MPAGARGTPAPPGAFDTCSRPPQLALVGRDRAPAQTSDPWGPEPSSEEQEAAVVRADRARAAALAQVLAGSLRRTDVAERLAITPQAVSERRLRGALIAVRRGREWFFPRWQFSDDDVLPGVAPLLDRYPGSALALSQWALAPHPDLDGHTPATVLARRGGEARVLALVEAIGAASW